eukprot:TRINITY_DN5521_c0_g1_i1.p1 TRINITY_DN5521_c0_g1~~TRINITY_DN5521_c0_g1_i1.p1  ORF type:complete len:110 (+),score=22.66 TRINITY_DN5521_c0_g1_i1:202-531(+)
MISPEFLSFSFSPSFVDSLRASCGCVMTRKDQKATLSCVYVVRNVQQSGCSDIVKLPYEQDDTPQSLIDRLIADHRFPSKLSALHFSGKRIPNVCRLYDLGIVDLFLLL